MKHNFQKLIRLSFPPATIFLGLLLMVISSCKKEISPNVQEESFSKVNKTLKDFTQVNLVGDNDEYSPAHIDANLINAWGISFPTSGPAWVSSAGNGLSFLFFGDGTQPRVPVIIPGAGA